MRQQKCTHKIITLSLKFLRSSFVTETDNTFFCFSATTSFEKNIPLQDSITTWQLTGISLSRSHSEDSVSLHDLTFYFYFFTLIVVIKAFLRQITAIFLV